MRVTGGQWRGRRLESVKGNAVRPTTDRVREALFNILALQIAESMVVDCCCGCGTLGIEALSRGARHVDFVDLASASLQTTRANLERCQASPDSWRLHRSDAVRWLTRFLESATVPVLVLADPPYEGPAAAALAKVLLAAPPSSLQMAAFEHAKGAGPVPHIGCAWTAETRSYGQSHLTLLRPAPAPDQPEADHA